MSFVQHHHICRGEAFRGYDNNKKQQSYIGMLHPAPWDMITITHDNAIANHQIIVTPRQGEAFRYKHSGEMQRLSPECFAPTILLMSRN